MKILIVYPPCRESATPILPLGLLYVAQPLIEDGHRVEFFDIALEKPTREEVIARIELENFDLMIIGGIITTYSYIKWLTNEVKKIYPDIPILGGGFVATPIPHIIFKNTGIDVVCNGEGDVTVREYVSALENNRDISNVAGLFIKSGTSFIKTSERPLVKNLDEISPPIDAYKLLDIERYITESGKARQPTLESSGLWDSCLGECRFFAVLSGRGCVGNCTFCYRMLKGLRKHSIPYVIKHIKYLVETYKINLFDFEDELFIGNKKWTDEFCDALEESKMDVRFRISSRADMITEDMLKKLRSVGCIYITVGFESGSQKMLDSMKKHIRVEHNYNAYKLLEKYNMTAMGVATILGMPGETHESIMETLKFIQDCKIESAANYYATPYPNSEIYQYAIKEGLVRDEEKYLEWISNSDAAEFKINLTQLSDSDLKYYTFLLNDACRKNRLQGQLENHKTGKSTYFKFLIKHYGIKFLYHAGLFGVVWGLNSMIESRKRKAYKI
ncbi:MAG: radical SAM protein [Candidatus Methanoperedens sp.]